MKPAETPTIATSYLALWLELLNPDGEEMRLNILCGLVKVERLWGVRSCHTAIYLGAKITDS